MPRPHKVTLSLLLITTIALCGFLIRKQPLTIYLAGDSTMANKQISAFPETGWGTRFYNFFDSTVVIVNKAQNGRSTKTFIAEKLWSSVTDRLKEGDYVLIQFGHNDEVASKASFTPKEDFIANLTRFVKETREKKAIPVLITPVARRKFDEKGLITDTHTAYAPLVCQVAAREKVMLIDLNRESMEELQKFGPEWSKKLFNYLEPGENPNYPDGKTDDTHFNELGARKIAEIVLRDLRRLSPEINSRVVKSEWKAK